MNALYKGFIVSAISSLVLLYPVTDYVLGLENTFNLKDKVFCWNRLILLWSNRFNNNWIINLGN